MEYSKFNDIITQIRKVVHNKNKSPNKWCYLTSIEYMVESRIYLNSMHNDLLKVKNYLKEGDHILDFGTGSGIFAMLLSKYNVSVDAIDTIENKSQSDPNFNDTKIKQKEIWQEFKKKFNVDFRHYDGKKLPFPDNCFDVITTYAVIEHITKSDLKIVMPELQRVLKPDGLLFVFKLPRKFAYIEYVAKLLNLGGHEDLYGDRHSKLFFKEHGFTTLEYWKSVLFFEYPGKITNKLYWIFINLEKIFNRTPLMLFSHDNNFVLRKSSQPENAEVLMIAPTFLPVVGGSETHINDLVNFLSKKNIYVNLIACTYNKKETPYVEKHKNHQIIRIKCLAPWMNELFKLSSVSYFILIAPIQILFSVFFMAKHHKRIKFVHVHAFTAGFCGIILKILFPKKRYALSVHGIYFSKNPKHLRYNKYAGYIRFISSFYDRIFAIGKRSAAELAEIGIDMKKIIRYRYWVDEGIFKPVRVEKKKRLQVLFVGRLIHAKGVDILLEAAKKMKDIDFLFAGEGDLTEQISSALKKYNNIKLLGRLNQEELPFYYSSSDLTILLSQNDGEGLPRVLIESLFCGTPVIGTDCGGTKELISSDVGFIVKRDIDSLIRCLETYKNNLSLQKKLKANARKYAQENFSINEAGVFIEWYKNQNKN
ncbi:MAG: glycosyltransferase [archaeon]